ncbi:PAS domain S-box-containing protein [Amycolatopsis tolypomycina]|uniref:histidine kinase n=1 Tax=Amycolatopsis tolypomycina TaxID=208445 RepID=A0A1H4YFB5_9PSEU|nr:SpoIIE family protein phosphatase [Amycolatopsis tolypomycina]SED15831.1 PAS domain S-box-containing protein [Amycolatopsis tolypomycina]
MSVGEEAGQRAVFPGTSRMAARMRDFDWASSPLGEPRDWPASLTTAVRICLTSRFPMIVWWGPELRFLYNDAYLPLLGTKHPALDKPGAEVWSEIWHIIGPMLDSVMTTGEATWSEDLLLPMNRHGYWEETYWTYSYSPVHDDEGTVRAVFTAVSDTTERVIGERRLATLRELGARAGVARTVDEACELVAGVLGQAGADVPYATIHIRDGDGALTLAAVTPGGEGAADAAAWPLKDVLADGVARTVSGEALGELPSGGWSTPPAEAVVLPLRGDAGDAATGVIVLAASAGRALDESYRTFLGLVAQQTAALVNGAIAYQVQQRRAEELTALDAAKTTFFANISHEFRTPLTLILGPAAELRETLDGAGERVREEVDVIQRNALRLGRLVNNLLDFSRIEAGRMQARFEPVDLGTFTGELASVFRAAVERAGLVFEVDCRPSAEPVHVDRGMWEKVVFNLLSNAVKFTFDGAIRVTSTVDGGDAVVAVSDTGIGIDAAELPRLFERFHRIPSARARSNEGSGIGLALVRELVGMHGGSVAVESAPGAGTTFRVRLPVGTRHLPAEHVVTEPTVTEPTAGGLGSGVPYGEAAEPYVQEALRWLPDEEQAARPAPAGTRVLVADDNADMRDYLVRLLRDDYAVTAVRDGVEAFAAACADPPELIISDVMMPRLDGLGLLAELRADPRTAAVPVLLLSARAGQEAAVDGLAAGADDYLVKPFSARELLARVRTTVQLARLRTQHSRWRTAMIESLQEGFFVCDDEGRVVEVNAAFGELLGFGTGGLPYAPPFPWWPDPETDAVAHRQVTEASERAWGEPTGSLVLPMRHRDGHRVWIALSYNQLRDDEGSRRVVGTIRDVTAERYAVQRESALAAMNQSLAGISGVPEVLRTGLELLRELWDGRRALAVTWPRDGEPELASTDPADRRWADLAAPLRATLDHVRSLPALHAAPADGGAGTTVDHPGGRLTLWVEPAPGRPLGTEDRTLLALLAGTLAHALRRAHRDDRQREVALALQRSILGPARLPHGFAVRYEPANPPLEVGGDWYDVVPLAGDRIGIVVGDCVGRGLAAAAVMGQLRSACRALLLEASSPAQTLRALDRFAGRLPGALCTTVFCGVLDPATGTLTYSSAGHPPATLVHRDGTAEFLDSGGSLPLAVRASEPRPEATAVVPIGSLLMLYTDGLVERRREALDDGMDRATSVAHDTRDAELGELAAALMNRLRPADGYEDDVALLLYRRSIPPLDFEFAAHPDHLASTRRWLRGWLENAALDPDLAQDVLVAAGEACANAVEHAYRDGSGATAHLAARLTGAHLVVTVTDRGHWKQPPPDNHVLRGRGVPMMEALADAVDIRRDAAGTTVTLEWRIGS